MGLRRLDNPMRAVVGATLALLVAMGLGGTAAAQSDTQAERDEVRDRRGSVTEQIDVLRATDAEIDAALVGIEQDIAAQETALADARAAADAAAAAVVEAEEELQAAHRDIEILEQAIIEMAVASYVHPPTADLVQSLQAQTLSDALKQRMYLDVRAQRDLNLLGLLEQAERRAAEVADQLAAAAVDAERAVEAADAELERLAAERQAQASFAADVQNRIDGALAEAAALADLDAELSAQIVAEQQALLARLPPAPVAEEATPAVATEPAPSAPPSTGTPTPSQPSPAPTTPAPTTPAPPTTAPPVTSPPTTAPPSGGGSVPTVPTPPLRWVGGFQVHAGIADDVQAMLNAAAADGITFGGSAYRSTNRQIQLRIQNCGGNTEYNIWYKPASLCNPPTAVPGRSLHEQGRALDLTYQGALIRSRANRGFQWLAANAASYGLFNLPSEPWHWSTTGG